MQSDGKNFRNLSRAWVDFHLPQDVYKRQAVFESKAIYPLPDNPSVFYEMCIRDNEVSANAIMKRATKHYIVVIQPIEIP